MFFSVVIPLYNKSYSIKRCIDSVLSQTYQSFELIVVNDGSTDNSAQRVIDIYSNEISSGKIRLLEQVNSGVSIARNYGIKMSNSEYICFLDADDEWLPDFLLVMYNLIMDYPDAVLYSLAHKINKKHRGLYIPKHGLNSTHRGYIDNFFKASSKGSVANSSKTCVKKSALFEFNGFPPGVVAGEDLFVWIQLALKGKVASEINYQSIVHIEDDESRASRANSVPYPLTYFSKRKDSIVYPYLINYLFVIFYKHFLSSLISLNFKEAYLRLKSFLKVYTGYVIGKINRKIGLVHKKS